MFPVSSHLPYHSLLILSDHPSCSVYKALDSQCVPIVLKVFKSPLLYSTELAALRRVQGLPGVVEMVGDYQRAGGETPPGAKAGETDVISLKFYPRGDLFSLVNNPTFDCDDEDVVRRVFVDIAKGVKACHSHGVVHLDIKLENVLIDDQFHAVLTDFGLAAVESTEKVAYFSGTKGYTAPEVQKMSIYDGKAADIYSLGITLYAMRMKTFPVQDVSTLRVINYSPGVFWRQPSRAGRGITQEFRDLFERMVRVKPGERIDIQEVLTHRWVQSDVATTEEIVQMMNR